MYGFQAISAANGWVITLVGLSIVFTGLLTLSAFVANMERLLRLWDRRASLLARWKVAHKPSEVPQADTIQPVQTETEVAECKLVELTPQQVEVLNHFKLITERWGENFALPRLLDKAEQLGEEKPGSNLDVFLKSGVIVEGKGELRGFYSWSKDVQIVAVEKTNETNSPGPGTSI